MSAMINAANLKFMYSLYLRVVGYSGPCIRIARLDDENNQLDVGFVNGYLDTAAVSAHVSGSSAVIVTDYDQTGNGFHMTQATHAKRTALVIGQSGHYVKRNTGGEKFLSYESAIGTFTQITLSVVWSFPVSTPNQLTQFQSGFDLGSILEFWSPQWTSFGSAYYRQGGNDMASTANWDTCRFMHDALTFNNGVARAYNHGALSTYGATSINIANPSLNRLRAGKNDITNGDFDWIEFSGHDTVVDIPTLAANVVATMPTIFTRTKVILGVGDSLSTAVYCSPGGVYTRYAYKRVSQLDWYTQGHGGYTIADWTARIAELGSYATVFSSATEKIAVVWLGTNDIAISGHTGAQVLSNAEVFAGLLKSTYNFTKVYWSTMISRNQGGSFPAESASFNTLLKAGGHTNIDGVVDTTTNPLLNNYADTEYFVDGVHLTASGQREYGFCVTKALFGSTSPNPDAVLDTETWLVDGVETEGTYKAPPVDKVADGYLYGPSSSLEGTFGRHIPQTNPYWAPYETQMAIFEALATDDDLIDLLGEDSGTVATSTKVLDYIPDKMTYPYVHLRILPFEPRDNATNDGLTCEFQIDVWYQSGKDGLTALGNKPVHLIQKRIDELLQLRNLCINGWNSLQLRRTFVDIETEEDNITKHGIQKFKLDLGSKD